MRDIKTIKLEISEFEKNPVVQRYNFLVNELREYEEKEAKKMKLQKKLQQQTNTATFLTNLKKIILNILNSTYIPNCDDAWLTTYAEYPDDIEINTQPLETYFLNYYNQTKKKFFEEIAYNPLIRIVGNNTIYFSIITDDDHYHDDLVEFSYNGNFNNIIDEDILDYRLKDII